MPLRREDGRPVCVLIRKATIDYVAKLDRGSAVYWGRADGRFEGVGITPRPEKVKWENYFTGMPNDDMAYWIALYLQTPHLMAAMRELWRAGECQPTVTDPLPAPVAATPPMAAAVAQEHDRISDMLATRTLDDTVSSLRKKSERLRLKAGEQNGAH